MLTKGSCRKLLNSSMKVTGKVSTPGRVYHAVLLNGSEADETANGDNETQGRVVFENR